MKHLVAPLQALKAKKKISITLNYQEILLVYNEGNVFAVMDKCPHRGVPLNTGTVQDKTIKCKDHGLAISLETGEVVSQRQIDFLHLDKYSRSVRTYTVEIEDDNVYIYM